MASTSRALLAALALLAATPGVDASSCVPASVSLGAQRRCKSGCPCGNTCISCARTCRAGSGSASGTSQAADGTSRRPEPAKAPPPAAWAPLFPFDPDTIFIGPLGADGRREPVHWVGSILNRIYVSKACPLAPLIPVADRRLEGDSLLLEGLGYRRLVVPGC